MCYSTLRRSSFAGLSNNILSATLLISPNFLLKPLSNFYSLTSVQEIYLHQCIIAVFFINTSRKNPTRTFELSTEVCLFQFIVCVSAVEWRIASDVQDYNHKMYFKHPSALSTLFEAVEGI